MEKTNFFKNLFKASAVKMIVSLTVTSAIAGWALVFVYNYAMPKIKNNIDMETKKAIASVFPGSKDSKKTSAENVFQVIGESGATMGYAFISEGNGYQGTIKILAGIDEKLEKLSGIEILESSETPGLGAEICNDKFRGQFKNLDTTHAIEYVKNQKPTTSYEIEAITGATISSRAVVNTLNKSITELKDKLGKSKQAE